MCVLCVCVYRFSASTNVCVFLMLSIFLELVTLSKIHYAGHIKISYTRQVLCMPSLLQHVGSPCGRNAFAVTVLHVFFWLSRLLQSLYLHMFISHLYSCGRLRA